MRQNPGVILRGTIYFLIPVLTVSVERATGYSATPPESYWEYVAWTCSALTAGFVALRAYIDQHISNEKDKADQK